MSRALTLPAALSFMILAAHGLRVAAIRVTVCWFVHPQDDSGLSDSGHTKGDRMDTDGQDHESRPGQAETQGQSGGDVQLSFDLALGGQDHLPDGDLSAGDLSGPGDHAQQP